MFNEHMQADPQKNEPRMLRVLYENFIEGQDHLFLVARLENELPLSSLQKKTVIRVSSYDKIPVPMLCQWIVYFMNDKMNLMQENFDAINAVNDNMNQYFQQFLRAIDTETVLLHSFEAGHGANYLAEALLRNFLTHTIDPQTMNASHLMFIATLGKLQTTVSIYADLVSKKNDYVNYVDMCYRGRTSFLLNLRGEHI